MATFPASVVTPERILIDEEPVAAVYLRTDDGDIAFLPGHTPLVGSVVPGMVRLEDEHGVQRRLAVHGGFVQVDPERVTILTPVAELAEEIDVDRARRALEEAERQVGEAGSGPAAGDEGEAGADLRLVEAVAAKRRAEVRLLVALGEPAVPGT
jgi:F-type H+-transporting ATPase subunit epsilon